MTEENEVLKSIVKELFPRMKLYENDVPKDFKRPCFIFIEPEDTVDAKELTKFVAMLTKAVTLYAYYKEDNAPQGDEIRRKVQEYLLREKKHHIPGSDRRYLTIDSCSTDTNKVECLVEFSLRISRTIKRNLPRPNAEKIKNIVHNIQLSEGGKYYGDSQNPNRTGNGSGK